MIEVYANVSTASDAKRLSKVEITFTKIKSINNQTGYGGAHNSKFDKCWTRS